ncbi:hypothetical protein IAD21_05465 [Abditibacteriota bacterium]|nr:hypothetical protein IAD21_05465 [Abditibacteriota bacterium]
MRRAFLFGPLAVCLLPLFGGCAKSPSGGPVTRATNRFQTTLSLAGTLNPSYYYAVAFDDAGGDGQGPEAILGNTTVPNRVVGGTFRLMVLYRGGNFRVIYRSTPSDQSTEREISGTNGLFVVTPRATQNGLNFTLDLDAVLPGTTTYIFPHTTGATPTLISDRFDINAITTNTIILDANDNRIKPVDAFGAQQVATPVEVQIGATRTLTLSDATGDENLADVAFTNPQSLEYVPFENIDITGLQIGITRSN